MYNQLNKSIYLIMILKYKQNRRSKNWSFKNPMIICETKNFNPIMGICSLKQPPNIDSRMKISIQTTVQIVMHFTCNHGISTIKCFCLQLDLHD